MPDVVRRGLLAAGKSADALLIYKSLTGADQPKHDKLGATRVCAGLYWQEVVTGRCCVSRDLFGKFATEMKFS